MSKLEHKVYPYILDMKFEAEISHSFNRSQETKDQINQEILMHRCEIKKKTLDS